MAYGDVIGSTLMELGDTSPTDLGLDGIGSADLLGLALCLFLTCFSLYTRSYYTLEVSAFAWLVVGFTIALNTQAPILFLLFFAVGSFQLVYALKRGWEK